jgi:S1-C subfamily serine protease
MRKLLIAFFLISGSILLAGETVTDKPAAAGKAETEKAVRFTAESLLQFAPDEHADDVKLNLEKTEKEYGRAVVKIKFTPIYNLGEIKRDPRQPEDFEDWGDAHGSGFFINKEGYIITNAHVVDNANRRTIKCQSNSTGNSEFEIELIGVGETDCIDIALLRLKPKEMPRFLKLSGFESIPFLRIADSDLVTKTEHIAVMGYPEDSDDLRAKQANLSGRQYLSSWRSSGEFQFLEVATASAVKSGNSGGAAVNRFGELIGIPARGDWTDSTGWLIPSNIMVRFLEEVANNEQGKEKMTILEIGIVSEKTFPGIAVLAGLPEDFIDFEVGMTVFRLVKGSLAEGWGIKPGDVILSFHNLDDDTCVYLDYEGKVKTTGKMRKVKKGESEWDNTDAFKRFLDEIALVGFPGQKIEIEYARRGVAGIQKVQGMLGYRELTPIPHLGVFEVPDFEEWAGMIVQDVQDNNLGDRTFMRDPKFFAEGLVIATHTDGGSLAEEREIGRMITAINGKRVRSLDEFRKAIKAINEAYDVWTKTADYVEEKARYNARYYALVEYRFWDEDKGEMVKREITVPIDKARQSGRSLDEIKKKE